jgi:hypothetical protein
MVGYDVLDVKSVDRPAVGTPESELRRIARAVDRWGQREGSLAKTTRHS